MKTAIYKQPEIVEETLISFSEVSTMLQNISTSEFERKDSDKWSIKEEFEHLILSTKAVSSALKLPKLVLRGFGKPRNPSRSFDALVKRYHEKLAASGVPLAAKDYAPNKSKNLSKEDMLLSWEMIMKKYNDRLKKWSEENLDKYLLPHPLLGKLTIREMMFFTIYHNHHHLTSMQTKFQNQK